MILEIVKYGHAALREKGARIKQVTPEIRQFAADMIETMYAADGVGLAAQQVARPLMLTVIDISSSEHPGEMFIERHPQEIKKRMPLVLVNPQISQAEGEQVGPEGCLSIPEVNADIRRAARIHVRAQTLDGTEIAFDCTGLLARAAQHEVDHLNGILFTDRMDTATRASFAGKLKKLQKETLSQLAKRTKPGRSLVSM
ncbi:MAG TPA: peptide deformylase [Verrucomicrobiae bacterium]|nr:peptide deformylase [Verrucomicrobiae bacterium]